MLNIISLFSCIQKLCVISNVFSNEAGNIEIAVIVALAHLQNTLQTIIFRRRCYEILR